MIRNIYGELVPHMPGAVSPMIAAGRAVKKMHPDAVTVFIGPCLAKKKEAKEPDICDAIDVVLTFQETAMLFEAMGIAPQQMEEDASEHSSGAGRIYARTGGVSEAVVRTVEQLHPGRKIAVRPMQADGGKACKQMIEAIQEGKTEANFLREWDASEAVSEDRGRCCRAKRAVPTWIITEKRHCIRHLWRTLM